MKSEKELKNKKNQIDKELDRIEKEKEKTKKAREKVLIQKKTNKWNKELKNTHWKCDDIWMQKLYATELGHVFPDLNNFDCYLKFNEAKATNYNPSFTIDILFIKGKAKLLICETNLYRYDCDDVFNTLKILKKINIEDGDDAVFNYIVKSANKANVEVNYIRTKFEKIVPIRFLIDKTKWQKLIQES